jgi:hypothetical protein
VLDVFHPHTADQMNRGPVFANVGDDPQSHGDADSAGRVATDRPVVGLLEPTTYKAGTC